MGMWDWKHWLIVGVIALLLFGKGKVSEFMGDVAKGIKAFKKGMAEDDTPKSSTAEPVKSLEHQQTVSPQTPVSQTEQKSN